MATARAGPPVPGDASPPVAYHLGDHLGSSIVVLDSAGALFSSEEYTPYGETSFGSYAKKRYRHVAKERDEESGFYYYSARYYAPWLSRWTSTDPLPKPAKSAYLYAGNNPLSMVDPSGAQESAAQPASEPATPSVNGTAGEGCPPARFEQQPAADFKAGPGAAPESTTGRGGGEATREASDKSASGPLDVSLSANASVSVGTKEVGQLNTKSSGSVEAYLLGTSGHLGPEEKESKSYTYESLGSGSGTWSKETYGEYSAHAVGASLSEHGLSASLADAEIKGYTSEQGAIQGTWLAGWTEVATLTVGELKGEAGIEEGSLSASVGATVTSTRLSVGFNLLGLNVSIFGEMTAGAKLGVTVGSETSVRVGLLGAGVTIGAAKTSEPRSGWLNLFEDLGHALTSSPLFFAPHPFYGGP